MRHSTFAALGALTVLSVLAGRPRDASGAPPDRAAPVTPVAGVPASSGVHTFALAGEPATAAAGIVGGRRLGAGYEDVTVRFAGGMSRGLYDWLGAALRGSFVRKSGEIRALDMQRKTRSVREFKDATITSVTFPALDAASREPASLAVGLSMGHLDDPRPEGAVAGSPPAPKAWRADGFRVLIDGVAVHATRIASFTVRKKEPATLEIPNVKITFAQTDEPALLHWQPDGARHDVRVEAIAADGSVLFTLALRVGVSKRTPEKVEAGGENIRRVTYEMACENVGLHAGGGALAP